jgi:hypothetical protein
VENWKTTQLTVFDSGGATPLRWEFNHLSNVGSGHLDWITDSLRKSVLVGSTAISSLHETIPLSILINGHPDRSGPFDI